MKNGYIKLHRKIIETSFFRDSYAYHLASTLLLLANHKENKFVFNGKEMTIKQGQLLTGRIKLSQLTGIKPSTVRDKLVLLKTLHFCDIKTNNKFSLITITKYKDYQILDKNSDSKTDNQPTTSRQPADTNNNVKNDKNVKNNTNTPATPASKTQFFERFKPETQDLMTKTKEKGLNIFALLYRLKDKTKCRVEIPEEIVVGVCNKYLSNGQVTDPWPYFVKVAGELWQEYNASRNASFSSDKAKQANDISAKEFFAHFKNMDFNKY